MSIRPPNLPNTSFSAYSGGGEGVQTINRRSATTESIGARGWGPGSFTEQYEGSYVSPGLGGARGAWLGAWLGGAKPAACISEVAWAIVSASDCRSVGMGPGPEGAWLGRRGGVWCGARGAWL